MLLAIVLFAAFIGIALTVSLVAMAALEAAFNAWDATHRASRAARFVVPELQPAVSAVPAVLPSRVHQWAQSA